MKSFIKKLTGRLQTTADPAGEEQLCPLPRRLDISSLGRVQVFAPHPDDEAIGCGGLLKLLTNQGHDVEVVLVTDGSGAGGLPDGAAAIRQQEFIASLTELGISNFSTMNQPDGAIEIATPLQAALLKRVATFKPDTVIMPSILDLHRDHRRIATMLTDIVRQVPSVKLQLQFEIWCPLPATHIVDITGVATNKWRAISRHATALTCGNYLSASMGLAQYRGLLLGQVGDAALAEAYLVEPVNHQPGSVKHWLHSTSQNMLRLLTQAR